MANKPFDLPSGEARSLGPADQNESVGPEDRAGTPKSPLAAGPDIGPAGEYRPASYKTASGVIREDR